MRIIGKNLTKSEHPGIWEMVEKISLQLKTAPPVSIIAGLDPTFFVTETKILDLDGEFKGKSLFLSIPFCRILNTQELSAIIGHEMAHFIGKDTLWSQRFYPIYKGSLETMYTLQALPSQNGFAQLSFFASTLLMSFFINSFQKLEAKISRERELTADQIGVNASSKEDMACALIKVHAYQDVWKFTQAKMKEALLENKQLTNISVFFNNVCLSLPDTYLTQEVGKPVALPHPIDTHPSLAVRLEALQFQISPISLESIKLVNQNAAVALINNPEKIEEELSTIEHIKLVKTGAVKIPLNNPETTK